MSKESKELFWLSCKDLALDWHDESFQHKKPISDRKKSIRLNAKVVLKMKLC